MRITKAMPLAASSCRAPELDISPLPTIQSYCIQDGRMALAVVAVRDSDLTAAARIRNAALRHFAARGVAATSIRDVARAARVSPGLVQHHFRSKARLRRAVDEFVIRRALEAFGTPIGGARARSHPLPGCASAERRRAGAHAQGHDRSLLEGHLPLGDERPTAREVRMTRQPVALRAFEGAVAVITGGASGIGKALAEALAE